MDGKGPDRRSAGNLVPETRQVARPPRGGAPAAGARVQAWFLTFMVAGGMGHRQEAVQGLGVPDARVRLLAAMSWFVGLFYCGWVSRLL